jgi:hypothetical protein
VPHHRCRQPGPARELFHYCIALLMVEAGKARLVELVAWLRGVLGEEEE